jgi:hypothetical protein
VAKLDAQIPNEFRWPPISCRYVEPSSCHRPQAESKRINTLFPYDLVKRFTTS